MLNCGKQYVSTRDENNSIDLIRLVHVKNYAIEISAESVPLIVMMN